MRPGIVLFAPNATVPSAAVERDVDGGTSSHTRAYGDALDHLEVATGPGVGAMAIDLGGARPGVASLERDPVITEREPHQVRQRRCGIGVPGDHELQRPRSARCFVESAVGRERPRSRAEPIEHAAPR